MIEHLSLIIFPLVIIIPYFVSKYRKLTQKNKIKELAAWTIIDNSDMYRGNTYLHDFIAKEQKNLSKEFHIVGEEEWRMTKKILVSFQKYLNALLLTDRLVLPKAKPPFSEKDFFMFNLASYLGEHESDSTFIGYEMHEKTISRKEYGSWGGPLYDATYSLTEFGVVFYKLYYISYCYCKNNKSINPDGSYYYGEKSIEDIIKSKRASISCM